MRLKLQPSLLALVLSASAMAAPGIAHATDIQMWVRASGATAAQHMIDLWNSSHDDKVVVTVIPDNQMVTKLATGSQAGDVPDMVSFDLIYMPDFMKAGFLKDITDEMKKDPNYEGVAQAYKDIATYDGKIYGVPALPDASIIAYNTDLFTKAGLDPNKPPTTWDELRADAKTIKEKTGVPGYGLPAKTMDNTMHQFLHYVYTNNGSVTDDKGNITLDSPENLAALEFVKSLVPYSEDGPSAYEQNDMTTLFSDGKVAMIEQGPWGRNQIAKTINWGVAALPTGPSAKGPGTLLITDSLAIFKGTGVEDQAMDLAKFLTNPENQFTYEKTHGLTPLRPVAGVADLVKEDPSWKPFLDGISNGGPEPLFKDYKGMQDAFITMVQSVVTGQAEPKAALTKAATDIKAFQ